LRGRRDPDLSGQQGGRRSRLLHLLSRYARPGRPDESGRPGHPDHGGAAAEKTLAYLSGPDKNDPFSRFGQFE